MGGGKWSPRGGTEKDQSKDKVAEGRRIKQTRLKQGMRGSCARASQHRLKTFKITSKGMKANELLDHSKQQRGNDEEMKKEEMDDLLKDAHEEEKAIRKDKVKTKEIRSIITTDVPIHGSWKANSKDENNITFLSVNVNSLAHWSRESNKVERLTHIFEKYRTDSTGLQEVCMNWAQLFPSMTLAQILQRTVENIRSVVSYNKRKGKEAGSGKVQRGGTATILREELTAYVTTSGVDPGGLGRWLWSLLEGEERYRTRVVTAYAPCGSAASNTETYYQQQVRYIVEKAPKTNAKEMF